MASANEASIWVSSAPIAVRNTPSESVQFGTPKALLKSFSQCFRLVDYLKSFKGTIR